MRFVAIVFVLQLSGVLHLAADLLDPDAEHCQGGCEDEGKECPPLCATCSCSHAGRPVVQTRVALAPALPAIASADLAYVSPLHARAATSELFRPPRG